MPADLFFHILKPLPPSDSLLSIFLHPSQKWPKTILSEMNSNQNLPVIALTANAMVNAQNLAALEEKTGPVPAMYRSLKSLLRPYVEDNESSKKEVSSDDWITVLEQMHQCVEQFDMDGVDHAMETMDTFQTPDKLKDLMEQLRVCVADVEMEEIMKLTDTRSIYYNRRRDIMHEIKSPFLILMEEQSYLAQSLESAFEKQDVKVKIVTIAEASSIVISEKPSGYLICTSPELLKKAVSVKVMVIY